MRSFVVLCACMLLLMFIPAIAQEDTGASATGQQTTAPQQLPTMPVMPLPQMPTGDNMIRNSPADLLMRQQQETPGLTTAAQPVPQLTEFQQFVAQSTGMYLPIYGQNFFRPPTTFAPLTQVPVSADYVIGPGDEIIIRAWGQVDVDYRDVVDRNGNLYVPKVGTLHVAGLRYDQLHDFVKTSISRIFHDFQMNTSLGSLRSIQIFVVGYAARPGGYTVSSMSTLVNAIFAAGGPAPNGSMRHILLRRGSEVVTDFDLYDLLLAGDKGRDQKLLPGDVIYFAPVGPQVAISGSVNQPAVYELGTKPTVGELLHMAGGTSAVAYGSKATVERIEDHRVREVASFTLAGDGLQRELRGGDLIRVAPVSARFSNAVTLRGNVAAPGRHPWREGMRVKDLVPDLYTLVTENYWVQQNDITRTAQAGMSATEQMCLPGSPYLNSEICANAQMTGATGIYPQPQLGVPGRVPRTGPQPQYPYQAPYPYGYPQPGPYGAGGQYSPNGAYQQPPAGYPYPQQYQGPPFEQPPTDTSQTSTLAGAQELVSGAQAALKMEIRRTAPDVNWNYALIERLNMDDLTTRLLPFNLRRAVLQPDSEDNLLLKPGDVVTIFSQGDMRVPIAQQSKYVYLEGEVKTPGVYKAEPGETLRQLVERVGGFTDNAYLFGAEFTRDSARAEQQTRLDQAVQQFEQEIERNASEQAVTNISNTGGSEELASYRTNLMGQRQLVDRLKQVKADGRVVLGIHPVDNSVNALPAIELEDGDRLVVPSRPSFVNVVGAVYNTSSFVYGKNMRTRDYLRDAGGGTAVADTGRLFIVRADGSVVSNTGGAFTGGTMSARLMPGDTIVVPVKPNKPGFMKGLRDWSYILGQIGLAAAAINVLK